MKKPKTEKQLIVSALRRAWMQSPSRRNALKLAKIEGKAGWSRCHYCSDEREKVTVDHRPPIGGLEESLLNIREYVNAMFFGAQFAACKPCHDRLTKDDRKKMREDARKKK